MNPVRLVDRWLALPLRGVIYVYRKLISPLLPGACRFEPSCSCYADEALKRWGFVRGFGLAFWRVCRCQPFAKGGWDPVPEGRDKRLTAPVPPTDGPARPRVRRVSALRPRPKTRQLALCARLGEPAIEEQL